MASARLRTERLVLRRFRADDSDALVGLDSDPEVVRFINGGHPTPRATIENDILPLFMQTDPNHPLLGFWAAEEPTSGAFLGWFAFRLEPESTNIVSLGYRFRRAAWGQGYATEGARALIDAAFASTDIQSVRASTYEDNAASLKVMERLGMRRVRAYRFSEADLEQADTAGAATDQLWPGLDLEYALDRSEWTRLQPVDD